MTAANDIVEWMKGPSLLGVIADTEAGGRLLDGTIQILRDQRIPHSHYRAWEHEPHELLEFLRRPESAGWRLIIVSATDSPELAVRLSEATSLPILMVPLSESGANLAALEAVASAAPNAPLATLALGTAGAKNAALYAMQVLGLANADIRESVRKMRDAQTRAVLESRDLP